MIGRFLVVRNLLHKYHLHKIPNYFLHKAAGCFGEHLRMKKPLTSNIMPSQNAPLTNQILWQLYLSGDIELIW